MAKSFEGDLEVKEALDKLASFAIQYCENLLQFCCSDEEKESGVYNSLYKAAKCSIGSYAGAIYYGICSDNEEEIQKAVMGEEEIRNSFEEALESGELHSSISELVKSWDSENAEKWHR